MPELREVRSILIGALVAVTVVSIAWGFVGVSYDGVVPSAGIAGEEQFGPEPRNTSFSVTVVSNGSRVVRRGSVHVAGDGLPARSMYEVVENGSVRRSFDGYQRAYEDNGLSDGNGFTSLFIKASFSNESAYESVVNNTSRASLRLDNKSLTAYYSSSTLRTKGPPFFGVDGRVVGKYLSYPSYERVSSVNDSHVVYEPRARWVRNVSGGSSTWRVHEASGRVVYNVEKEQISRADVRFTLSRDETWSSVWFEGDSGEDRKRVRVEYRRGSPESSFSAPSWVTEPV